jgi:EpsI family protein
MNRKNLIFVTLILITSSFIGFIGYLPNRFEGKNQLQVLGFPRNIGEWSAEDIPLTENAYKMLSIKNVILRNYANGKGDSINLYIVYSPDNRRVSYPPEIQFQGRGSTITYTQPVSLTATINSTSLIIEKIASRELIVYWYKIGNVNTNNYFRQQFQAALHKTLGKKKSVALIRVLCRIEGDKDTKALEKIKTFCRLIEPLFEKYIP